MQCTHASYCVPIPRVPCKVPLNSLSPALYLCVRTLYSLSIPERSRSRISIGIWCCCMDDPEAIPWSRAHIDPGQTPSNRGGLGGDRNVTPLPMTLTQRQAWERKRVAVGGADREQKRPIFGFSTENPYLLEWQFSMFPLLLSVDE